jgi:hypothetical protein
MVWQTMNERIKELAEQVYGSAHYDDFKFAELIVRECLDIARDRAAFDGFPPNDVNHIIDEIKQHFGVTE